MDKAKPLGLALEEGNNLSLGHTAVMTREQLCYHSPMVKVSPLLLHTVTGPAVPPLAHLPDA